MSYLSEATDVLKTGGVVAYPTEAVYGLGCDPLNETATHHLLSLKKRSVAKGLILIAADWEQLIDYVTPLSKEKLTLILSTWPGPITWILPASKKTPKWVKGTHDTIAVRVTAHPVAKSLCETFGGALVSTSANVQKESPARTADEVRKIFASEVYVVEGEVGKLLNPTEIRDGLTGKVVRKG